MRDLPDPSVTLVGKKFKSPFLVLDFLFVEPAHP
jgi:hypothetical protein